MFSPIAQVSVTSINETLPLAPSKSDQNNAPFDVKWLAETFNFECADVLKAEFKNFGLMFSVNFKSGKESAAKKFYETLIEKGCHPQYFEFNNSVYLNKNQKEKILSAGLPASAVSSDRSLISQGENIVSTKAQVSVTSINETFPLAPSKSDQNKTPFDVKWLAETFNFDCEDVKKAEFENLGLMFEIYFKSGKESIAEKFCETLTEKGCHPHYYEFNNSVHLNKYQKEKILSAGLLTSNLRSDRSSIFQGKVEKNSLLNGDQILITQKFEAKLNIHLPEKTSKVPFDLSWLQENYKLDLDHVKKAEFSSIFGCGYEIKFKPESNLARNAFIAILIEAGCKPEYNQFSNAVELKASEEEKLIAGAEVGKKFIPPIENEAAINGILKKGILLAKFFLSVLPSAQVMKSSHNKWVEQSARESYNCWFEQDTGDSQRDNAAVEHFLTEIEPHLTFIKQFLSDPEYKKKLEYYYITEEKLIARLEKFVNNQNKSLRQALLDSCWG